MDHHDPLDPFIDPVPPKDPSPPSTDPKQSNHSSVPHKTPSFQEQPSSQSSRLESIVTFRKHQRKVEVKVYLSNIPSSWNEQSLYQHFQEYDQIYDSQVLRTKDGLSRGIGFLKFGSITQADQCIAKYNKTKESPADSLMQLKYASGERERLGIQHLDDQ